MRINPNFTFIMLITLTLAAISGCAPPAPAETQSNHYAAQLTGSEIFIGIAVNGEEVTAYLCDGTDSSIATVSEWFKGSVSGGSFDLTSGGEARLTGSLTSGGIQGNVSLPDGRTFAFTASLVGEEAGLFWSEKTIDNEHYLAGWIILSDRQQRGSVAFCPGGGIEKGVFTEKHTITSIPIPRLPDTKLVQTSLGTFTAIKVGSP